MTAALGSSPTRGAPRSSAPLVIYVIVQIALGVSASVIRGRTGSAINLVGETVAVAALAYGVIRRRPNPRAAWWFVLAAVTLFSASGFAIGLLGRLNPTQTIHARLPSAFAGVGQLALVIGLTLLSRGAVRRGAADFLDAVMTSLAVYLLLWIGLIEPALTSDAVPVSIAVTLPITSLLVFTSALRLVFAGGLRDPAIAMVLVGTAVLLLTFGILIGLALRTGALRVYEGVAPLGSVFFGVFGAAGLLPALRRPRPQTPTRTEETGRLRIALFAVLALVPPIAGATDVLRGQWNYHESPVVLWVPILVSTIFILALVVRLGLAIRVAQHRADELVDQTAALERSLAEQEELQRQMRYRALHDPLTGLANRTVLTDAMERALNDPDAPGRPALLLLDLDHFKDINDTLGHPVGDGLLIDVANRLRDLTPRQGTLVRLGGDEFAVFLARADTESALALAERFRSDLARVYDIGGRELFVTTSVGVLVTAERATRSTPADVLRDADLALYAAKSAGKDRVTLFHPELRMARLDHARISAGLRRAMTNDELVLHYQPVLDVASGTVVAVEALLRWRVEGGRLLPPNDFIPVAEETGQVGQIGAWALRRSLRDAQRWFLDHAVTVAVNVSGQQLADPDFASAVLASLHEHDLPGRALVLEITESSLVGTSHTNARGHLDRLREHGVRVAIDDFGTGYSSLSYVSQLPVDIVKIDKSFTQALGDTEAGSQDWAFTQAILQMVASLDKLAIAEGVETAEQAAALSTLHCPLVQGFHYSRPVPADVIDRTLARSTVLAAPTP